MQNASPRQVLSIPDEMIPEGKIISTIQGGKDALEISMEKLKQFGFTGYLHSRIARDGYSSEGYLIFKDGDVEAAIYGRQVSGKFIVTSKSEEGLKLVWGDSYDVMCDLVVHGRVDIEAILRHFPDSRMNAPQRKAVKRKTRFTLEWGNNGEAGPPKEAIDIPEDLKRKLEEWRSQGYIVKFLEEEIKRDPGAAAMAFEQFESNIRRAEFLRNELDTLDCQKFTADAERLRAMLRNPSKITSIEANFQGLKLKVDQEKLRQKEEKIAELMVKADVQVPEIRLQAAEKQAPLVPLRTESAVPPAALKEEETEEKLAGHGFIIPPDRAETNFCTVCGAELHDKNECPTCGANSTLPSADQTPVGDSNLIPALTFDNFILCDSNRFSHSAALAVARAGSSSYNPLFICSATGLGKTHLLNAIGNYVVKNHPEKRVLYLSSEAFINEFTEANRNNRKKQFRKKLRDIDFLLLDDIQLIVEHDAAQDELHHSLSTLFKEGKQMVITCNRPIRDVAGVKERLVSLFDSGLPTDMQAPDTESRLVILRQKATEKRIKVGDDVLRFIAERYRLNVRVMEGALKTLVAYSELMNSPMNLETAKQALKDEPEDPHEPEAETIENIMPLEQVRETLKVSHSYLIEEERPVKCFEYLVDSLNRGMRGMALTRVNPKRLKEQYDLGNATVLWLTDKEGDAESRVMPVLERIIYRIEDFLNMPGKSILLLDGLDYLVSNNNFDSVLKFLRRLIDEISESEAILITSITPETLDEQALNILEREMEILSYLPPKK